MSCVPTLHVGSASTWWWLRFLVNAWSTLCTVNCYESLLSVTYTLSRLMCENNELTCRRRWCQSAFGTLCRWFGERHVFIQRSRDVYSLHRSSAWAVRVGLTAPQSTCYWSVGGAPRDIQPLQWINRSPSSITDHTTFLYLRQSLTRTVTVTMSPISSQSKCKPIVLTLRRFSDIGGSKPFKRCICQWYDWFRQTYDSTR